MEVISLGCDNTDKKNRMTPVKSKPLLKKQCIVKTRTVSGTYKLKLKNSNTGRRKDCNKKIINVCPLRRKKERKKGILIRKYIKRVACPQPEINVIAPQGIQGLPGSQGIQGPLGPPGPVVIPDIIILPSVQRYFYIVTSDTQSFVTIPAYEFTNDEGTFITAFTDNGQNSYSNLYINGILQEGSLYSLNKSALTIDFNNQIIYSGTPIILEIIQFFAQVAS
jgi:hypothetical protein